MPAKVDNSLPKFFSHRYESGKRGYKAFRCHKCPAIVRVDQMPAKGVWQCADCLKSQRRTEKDEDEVYRDGHRHKKVSTRC